MIPLLKLSAQLIGRSLDIHFPRYHSSEKELSQFQNVLRTFQDVLPFTKETDVLLKHWEFCYQRSIGCVGNLRLMLVRAVRAALWTDAKALTWKHIQTYAFTEAESYEMMLEAYEGERNLAPKPKQHEDLLKMLGLPSKRKAQKAPQPDTTPDKDPASKPNTPQDEQQGEGFNEAAQELSTMPVVNEIAPKPITPPASQPGGNSSETAQKISSEMVSPVETLRELKPVSGSQHCESADPSIQEISARKTSSEGMPPKPLKKPHTETPRPFRRKAKRDRTGGPPLKGEDKN